jgi:hypothetical protein
MVYVKLRVSENKSILLILKTSVAMNILFSLDIYSLLTFYRLEQEESHSTNHIYMLYNNSSFIIIILPFLVKIDNRLAVESSDLS